MSFVMIAAGPAGCSRVRTLSARSVLAGCALVALGLLTAGAGIGHWMAQLSPPSSVESAPSPSLSAFTVEQLGALSGRLAILEREASRLSERLGVSLGAVAGPGGPASAANGARAGRGGPMLPPRPADDTPGVRDTAADPGRLGALGPRLEQIEQQMALVADAAMLYRLALMRLPSRLPVEGVEPSSAFGNRVDPFTGRRAFHAGMDFAAEHGAPIHAAAGGTVRVAGFRPDYGWTVEVDHGNGLSTRYAHASRLDVKVGDIVAPGDRIAAVGSSGRSTGPHLHFEVLRHGAALDPRRYLAGL
jgi:murein DD-endopeptidase MepM/ murein hydrolase activator NlpD